MLETLIGAVTEAVFGYLLEQAGHGVRIPPLFQRDPQRLAFQVALTRTYAIFDSQYPEWIGALFDQHFLTHGATPLLAQCLLRDDPPTGAKLAEIWANYLGLSDELRTHWLPEAIRIASDFLMTLDGELRARSEFQPLFDSRALDTTADATSQTAQATTEMAEEVRQLREELNQLLKQFMTVRSPSQQDIHNSVPNQGVQGIFYGPVNILSQSPLSSPPTNPAIRSGANPFVPGPIRNPERFYGRKEQLADIKSYIGAVEPTSVAIIGIKYSGKSSLLFYIKNRIDDFCTREQKPIVVYINLRNRLYWSLTGLVEGLHREIKSRTGLEFWQISQSSDHWSFQSGLENLYANGYRLIVLLDEFEAIRHRLEHFQGWGEDWHAKATEKLLTMVLASQRPLRNLYATCGLVSPFGNIFIETRLGAFETATWYQLVRDGFNRVGYRVNISELDFIEDVAGGTPYYTQLAAAMIWQYRDLQKAREQFRAKAQPHFEGIWNALDRDEQSALLHIVGIHGFTQPSLYMQSILRKQGLIKTDGSLFSSIFAEFIQTKP